MFLWASLSDTNKWMDGWIGGSVVIKTKPFKTKTGSFGLETTRDQDHGLEDNNTDWRTLIVMETDG